MLTTSYTIERFCLLELLATLVHTEPTLVGIFRIETQSGKPLSADSLFA